VNDLEEDIERLVDIVRRTRTKLNLIPFNPVKEQPEFVPPPRKRVIEIRDGLLAAKLPVSVRWSKGGSARAACGQLALLSED
jgi:23S rRNA (adenine2503-C2)-methyltransferase